MFEGYPEKCPICDKYLTGVGARMSGMYEVQEIHCSTISGGCGYALDPEKELRAFPSRTTLMRLGLLETARANGIPVMDWEDMALREQRPNIWQDERYLDQPVIHYQEG